MSFPSTYSYRDGFWWSPDGSGPYVSDSAGTARNLGYMFSLLSGELAQFNRLAGGALVQYVDISASGIAVAGPCIVWGVKCVSGTTPTLVGYDASSATGTAQITTGTATAETYYSLAGLLSAGSMGVMMNTGFYATLGGTTPVFRVFYAPGV